MIVQLPTLDNYITMLSYMLIMFFNFGDSGNGSERFCSKAGHLQGTVQNGSPGERFRTVPNYCVFFTVSLLVLQGTVLNGSGRQCLFYMERFRTVSQ